MKNTITTWSPNQSDDDPLKRLAPAGPGWNIPRRSFLASLSGLVGIGGASLAGCGGSSDSLAALRFVNGTVDYATADFYVSDTRVYAGLANGGAATGYGSVTSGTLQVSLRPAGSSSAALTASHAFATDSHTSVLAYGSLATSLTFRYFDESNAAASAGTFNVRVFHGAPALAGLDVYITNTSSLSGLAPTLRINAYADLSSFATLNIGTYRVRITRSGDQRAVLFDFTTGLTIGGTTVLTLAVAPRSSGSLPNIAVLPERTAPLILANALA